MTDNRDGQRHVFLIKMKVTFFVQVKNCDHIPNMICERAGRPI